MSELYELMQKKGTTHRVAPLRTRDFRAQPFSGDTVCRSTGIHDMGGPMYEWKELLLIRSSGEAKRLRTGTVCIGLAEK